MKKEFIEKYKNEVKRCLNDLKHKDTIKKQVPNMLTASRMIAPIFIVPTVLSGNLLGAGILAIAFALTDAFDGYFARKYDAVTEFGRELDPVSDKIFATGLIIPLVILQPVLLINLALEAVIALINVNSKAKGNNPKTVLLGKLKTASLSLLLITLYVSLSKVVSPTIVKTLLLSTTLLQVFASIKYFVIDKEKDDVKKNELINVNNLVNDSVTEKELEKINLNKLAKEINNGEIQNKPNISLQIDELNKLKEEYTKIEEPTNGKVLSLKKDNKN